MDKIDQLLDARLGADSELEKYKVPITILFTDIKDSTKYFETEGDVEGLAMVHLHNKLLFPVIERMKGVVVKTIGDAIMARFDDPKNALRAAIGMQKALETFNQNRTAVRQIRIRIGLHHGKAILKNNDVYGDTVNTAARVEHEAQPSEVRISVSLAEAAKAIGAATQEAGEVELKGKADKVKLLTVDWKTYEPPLKAESNTRNFAIIGGVASTIVVIALAVHFLQPAATVPSTGASVTGGGGAMANVPLDGKTGTTTSATSATSTGDTKAEPTEQVPDAGPAATRKELEDLLLNQPLIRTILENQAKTQGGGATTQSVLDAILDLAVLKETKKSGLAVALHKIWLLKYPDTPSDGPCDPAPSPFEDMPGTSTLCRSIAEAHAKGWIPTEGKRFEPGASMSTKAVSEAISRFAQKLQ